MCVEREVGDHLLIGKLITFTALNDSVENQHHPESRAAKTHNNTHKAFTIIDHSP